MATAGFLLPLLLEPLLRLPLLLQQCLKNSTTTLWPQLPFAWLFLLSRSFDCNRADVTSVLSFFVRFIPSRINFSLLWCLRKREIGDRDVRARERSSVYLKQYARKKTSGRYARKKTSGRTMILL